MIYAGDNSENNLTYSNAPTLPSQAECIGNIIKVISDVQGVWDRGIGSGAGIYPDEALWPFRPGGHQLQQRERLCRKLY